MELGEILSFFFFSSALRGGKKCKDDLTGVESIFTVPWRPIQKTEDKLLLDFENLEFCLDSLVLEIA